MQAAEEDVARSVGAGEEDAEPAEERGDEREPVAGLGKDQAEVERDYDPRLVRFLQDWMRKHKLTPI